MPRGTPHSFFRFRREELDPMEQADRHEHNKFPDKPLLACSFIVASVAVGLVACLPGTAGPPAALGPSRCLRCFAPVQMGIYPACLSSTAVVELVHALANSNSCLCCIPVSQAHPLLQTVCGQRAPWSSTLPTVINWKGSTAVSPQSYTACR